MVASSFLELRTSFDASPAKAGETIIYGTAGAKGRGPLDA
jgi:hypothetical protein